MFNPLQRWRERGWRPISADLYAQMWERLGGSVMTHPQVVSRLSALAGISVRYLGWPLQGELRAAVPVWGRHLALSRDVLKRQGRRDLFDLGNAEVILPIAAGAMAPVRQRMRYVAALHEGGISTLRKQREELALARQPEEYGKKFRYNQRRELRMLEGAGGEILPVSGLSPDALAAIYTELFEKRWGFAVPGKQHLCEVFDALKDFLWGNYLQLDGNPIAVQVLYRVESPDWISIEYINGGVDPASRDFSPGSVLSFINTQSAWEDARARGKPLRYSFGRADVEYKDRWCNRQPVFQV
ncbi:MULTISPECIES: GNAT family N-acetyltransferase [unclassified Pseudomonas]|uniref:GNAT family N-acetyltransferase n=1 Tax=unclassified Pseudomonas TaxID=196821 RepID=UPI0023B9F635|nr:MULTISPECIES: GNAT family N-acetyltransferase [Pseudomonas]MDH1279685.1 antimicrobial resistance protein Mig-14 [Pseudomonas chengduensis]